MSKFKAGDIAIVCVDELHNDIKYGEQITIVGVIDWRDGYGSIYTINESTQGYYDVELEHKYVFNSPLYKALK